MASFDEAAGDCQHRVLIATAMRTKAGQHKSSVHKAIGPSACLGNLRRSDIGTSHHNTSGPPFVLGGCSQKIREPREESVDDRHGAAVVLHYFVHPAGHPACERQGEVLVSEDSAAVVRSSKPEAPVQLY